MNSRGFGATSRVNSSLAALFVCLVVATLSAETPSKSAPGVLPVTTKSPEARQLFVGALVKLENLHGPEAMQDLRKAVRQDPDFALANIMITFASVDPTVDPAEQVAARTRANASRSKVSAGERLVIDWLTNSSEGKMVPAIQAMNEVLEEYPNDKYLAWLGAVWVENQQEIKHAIPMFEHAIQLNPDFAPPMNELAYCYARTRNFDKAFATMQRYIALLPNEPNPQDTYAEILRMSGRFDEALEHYRASLKIDPGFVFSQVGIADTYALIGDEARARAEYDVAVGHATSKAEAANWRLQSAISYIREKNLSGADTAFRAAAEQAHRDDLAVPEAEAYRMMAAYQPDNTVALELLNKAEAVLREKHALPKLSRQQELALVLRGRVPRAAQAGNNALADLTLKRLGALAESTHDQVVQIAYDGAAGTLLAARGSYAEALVHLEEDDRNPISVKWMVVALQKTGQLEQAAQLTSILVSWNEPTLEQALVVPEFRAHQPQTARSFSRM
jgi:tetratricopeptide (TPR) repeat protein